MCNCNWEIIEEFSSLAEFKRFCAWIESQLEKNVIEQISVKNSYAGEYFEEKWFKCKESGQVWRLVYPDPGYFPGVWEPVDAT